MIKRSYIKLSGILFLILSVTRIRELIIDAIPRSQKMAISAGIGLFLGMIALKNAGIVKASPDTIVAPPKVLRALAEAADGCWEAIRELDLPKFGLHTRASFDAQVSLFPRMINEAVTAMIGQYRKKSLGWKLSGAGGGGYLVLVSHKPIPGAIRIKIRRAHV